MYQYDAVSNKHNDYTFDSENRLTRGVYGVAGKTLSSPWSYTYNSDGLRMGKSQFQTSTCAYAWGSFTGKCTENNAQHRCWEFYEHFEAS